MTFRRTLTISAIALLAVFSAHAQTLSGYTGSTRATDGYSGNIKKVTITKTIYNPDTSSVYGTNRTEIVYDTKGRRISLNSDGNITKYTYGNDSLTTSSDGKTTAKASFNSDGTLKEQTSFNTAGNVLRRDTYIYGAGGKITEMRRTDSHGDLISKWIYTTDERGNTVVMSEDGSSCYVFSPAGVLLKEIKSADGFPRSEKTFDENGFEASEKEYIHPLSATMMQNNIPTTDITYETERKTDEKGRIKEIVTVRKTKLNDKWLDADGNLVSSEERKNWEETFSWLSYRYDGKLAEVQTETWTSPTGENPTGYSSLAHEYMYDSNGVLTQIVTYDETGSESDRMLYKYDDNGKLFYTITENDEKTLYAWNDDESLASKLCYQITEDGSYFNTSIEEYSYNKDGSTAKKTYTNILMLMGLFGEKQGVPVQFATRATTLFYYDNRGLLKKMQIQCEDRTETEFYAYDNKERKTIAALYVEYNDNDAYYKETSYSYEDDVDFTKITEYNSYRTKKTYTYDKSGNIKTVKEYEIRYKDGTHADALCSVTEYAYEL